MLSIFVGQSSAPTWVKVQSQPTPESLEVRGFLRGYGLLLVS